MAANRQQGRYLTLFWAAVTLICAGIAYVTGGFGKLVLILGLAAALVFAPSGLGQVASPQVRTLVEQLRILERIELEVVTHVLPTPFPPPLWRNSTRKRR